VSVGGRVLGLGGLDGLVVLGVGTTVGVLVVREGDGVVLFGVGVGGFGVGAHRCGVGLGRGVRAAMARVAVGDGCLVGLLFVGDGAVVGACIWVGGPGPGPALLVGPSRPPVTSPAAAAMVSAQTTNQAGTRWAGPMVTASTEGDM
jgi:hypothetical protein